MLVKILFYLIITTISFAQDNINTGFRASRILNSYPNHKFPSADYWADAGNFISTKFDSSIPSAIWIVSLYCEDGYTQLNFPNPGGNYQYIWFTSDDKNEEYLTKFDSLGFKIWLQVEQNLLLLHLPYGEY